MNMKKQKNLKEKFLQKNLDVFSRKSQLKMELELILFYKIAEKLIDPEYKYKEKNKFKSKYEKFFPF